MYRENKNKSHLSCSVKRLQQLKRASARTAPATLSCPDHRSTGASRLVWPISALLGHTAAYSEKNRSGRYCETRFNAVASERDGSQKGEVEEVHGIKIGFACYTKHTPAA